MNEEGKSKFEQLDESLYSRTKYQSPTGERSAVKDRDTSNVEDKWHSPELSELLMHEREEKPLNPTMKKFFTFSLLFFLATVFIAAFIFLGGSNFISSKNLDIVVDGPTSAPAGQPIELGVTVENRNNTSLEESSLSVQFPEDTRDPSDQTKALTFSKFDLGSVKAGGQASRTVKAVLLGSSGEVKEIKFSLEYKVKGSSATFYKDKVYQITIGEAPVSINVDSPPKVSSGEGFITKITVKQNSTEVLRNVMLRAEYPYGYTFESSSPEDFADNNVWSLGDLSPGAEKMVSIRGHLVGENQDERTFRFYVGLGQGNAPTPNFRSILISSQETIGIEKPSISVNPTFNGESAQTYIAPAGQNILTNIRFQNNLPEKIINPRLEVRLSGSALNPSSVLVQNNGVYNAASRRVNWSLTNSLGALELAPGESGSVAFGFASMPETVIAGSHDISVQFILTGTTVANEPVTVTETRTVRIGSQVNLSAQALYSTGPFTNSGPVPPKVGKETTYSVVWTIGNTYNDLNDAKVTAKLGYAVKWKGGASAGGENVTYDENSNTITWNMGGVSSGLGFNEPPRSVAFQVSLTPLSSQTGSAPTLVSNISFSAYDTGLGKNVTVTAPALTTRTSNDPAFIQGNDIVVR